MTKNLVTVANVSLELTETEQSDYFVYHLLILISS